MKSLVLIGFLFASAAQATIEGPSCGDLTKKQNEILKSGAKKYIQDKGSDELTIVQKSVEAVETDCHDYDGVHSTSVFTVEWTQIDNDQKMACQVEIDLSVNYEGEEKIIDENSTFEINEISDIECVN